MDFLNQLSAKEQISILLNMLNEKKIDELDLFAMLCILCYGYYCDLGREEDFLKNNNLAGINIEVFKKLNKSIHKTPIESLMAQLIARDEVGGNA